jgi:hypothetical protein
MKLYIAGLFSDICVHVLIPYHRLALDDKGYNIFLLVLLFASKHMRVKLKYCMPEQEQQQIW